MAIKTRRIGLGFTGLADALVMLGVRYGSQKSFNIAHSIIEKISYVSWHTSARLAKQKSSFPLFKKKLYLKGKFVETLPDEIQQLIHRYGMRNSHHNAIAPTGTISLLANNVSNGIEPIFAEKFQRKVRYDKGEAITYTIKDYAYQCWQDLGKSGLPPEWISTHSIAPEEHLKMQSVIQPFIDNAISKTINLPVDFPYEKLTSVFTNAYKLGLKGCTIFRPNPVTGSVVEIDDIDKCCPI